MNLHRFDPNTGSPITGGTAVVNMHEVPDDYNVYFADSVYDFDVLNSIIYDTPVVIYPNNPTPGGLQPWMTTGQPTVTAPFNGKTPHGYNVVNGQKIHLDFLQNITFADNVQFTANDYNFSLWYSNANGAYGPYVSNTGNYVGVLPSLTDSQVTSKFGMDIYLNTTSSVAYLVAVIGIPIVPEHLWSHVGTAAFNGDVNPIDSTNNVNGQLLLTGTGPFYWSKFVQGSYVSLLRFPGYFKTNIHAWQLPQVQVGNAEPVTFAITQTGTPIPSSASATAKATLNGGSAHSTQLTLGSNGNWTGSFSTTGWTPGFYEVTVNATYTDSSGQAHEALQFYGLNVLQAPPPAQSNLQVTVTSGQGTPISGASVTVGSQTLTTGANGQVLFQGLQPGTVTVSVTASGFNPASTSVTLTGGQTSTTSISLSPTSVTTSTSGGGGTTTTSAPPPAGADYTYYYVGAAVVIILLIIGVVAYSRRGKT